MKRGCALGIASAIALTFATIAVAQEYSFRQYGRAEGLRNQVVLSLAQDHAGYITPGRPSDGRRARGGRVGRHTYGPV